MVMKAGAARMWKTCVCLGVTFGHLRGPWGAFLFGCLAFWADRELNVGCLAGCALYCGSVADLSRMSRAKMWANS